MKQNKTTIRDVFETYLSVYRDELGYSIVFQYCGQLDRTFIQGLAVRLESDILKYGDKRNVVKRLFSILIEGVQNVLIHGDFSVDDDQKVFLIIAKNPMHYKILMGNFIKNENKSFIINYIGNINSHDEVELHKLYLKYLKEGMLSNDGNQTGLGLISMRMKSNKPIEYSLYNLAVSPLLTISVEINRNK